MRIYLPESEIFTDAPRSSGILLLKEYSGPINNYLD